jgi:adenosylhomocysteine nucleosidase
LNVAGVVAALAAEARALKPPARGGEARVVLKPPSRGDKERVVLEPPARGGAARVVLEPPATGDKEREVLTDGTIVAVSGIGCAAAAVAARRLIEAGATALVSWGLAGALDPTLQAGTVCVPSEVLFSDGTSFPTARYWREPLAASIAASRPVAGGTLLTSSQAIDTVAAKAAAFTSTGAAAVDMESAAVAQVAAAHHLPFIAIRVVVDRAVDAVPRAVVAASRAGQVQFWPLIRGLAASPADIAPLIRLAQRYRVAIRSLIVVAGTGRLAPPACVA